MALDKRDQKKVHQLREKRMQIADKKESTRKRSEYGGAIVAKVNMALQQSFRLEHFNQAETLPVDFDRRPNFRNCPGLVAAYTSEVRAQEITSCCDKIIGNQAGKISFDEYGFMGVANVETTSLSQLLELAKLLHDSVLFCPVGTSSIVLLDHYKVSGTSRDEGFSIVIQGRSLVEKLASCFQPDMDAL